jgi:hypothetical protein
MDQKHGSTATANRRGAAHYRTLLREQEASGKTVRAFALERGLSPWTLYEWRGKLGRSRRRSRAAADTTDFVAVDVVGSSQGAADFEVVLTDGVRVRVPRDVAIVRLAELVRSLRSC